MTPVSGTDLVFLLPFRRVRHMMVSFRHNTHCRFRTGPRENDRIYIYESRRNADDGTDKAIAEENGDAANIPIKTYSFYLFLYTQSGLAIQTAYILMNIHARMPILQTTYEFWCGLLSFVRHKLCCESKMQISERVDEGTSDFHAIHNALESTIESRQRLETSTLAQTTNPKSRLPPMLRIDLYLILRNYAWIDIRFRGSRGRLVKIARESCDLARLDVSYGRSNVIEGWHCGGNFLRRSHCETLIISIEREGENLLSRGAINFLRQVLT